MEPFSALTKVNSFFLCSFIVYFSVVVCCVFGELLQILKMSTIPPNTIFFESVQLRSCSVSKDNLGCNLFFFGLVLEAATRARMFLCCSSQSPSASLQP